MSWKRFKTILSMTTIVTLSFLGLNSRLNINEQDLSHQKTKLCLMKYFYFFPVLKNAERSVNKNISHSIHLAPNFTKFCHCQNTQVGNIIDQSKSLFAKIDICSNLHLDHFEHQQQYNLNLRLMIEPQLLELVDDNLRFLKPIVTTNSYQMTSNCMVNRIIENCNKRSSLNMTNKCAHKFLLDDYLYKRIYRECHYMQFRPMEGEDVIKI